MPKKLVATWQNKFNKQGLAQTTPDSSSNALGPHQQRALEHLHSRFFAADLGNKHGKPRLTSASQIVSPKASLTDVVKVLTRHRQCLIEQDGRWQRIVREDFSSPIARMWLFGIITSIELDMKWHIQNQAEAGGNPRHIGPARPHKPCWWNGSAASSAVTYWIAYNWQIF